jgi:hypothetical protein
MTDILGHFGTTRTLSPRIVRNLTVFTDEYARRPARRIHLFGVMLLLIAGVLLLSACSSSGVNLQNAAPTAQASAPSTLEGVIEPLSAYATPPSMPTPTPSAQQPEKQFVTVATQGVRANLRNGPGTNFAIVTKVNSGSVLEVLGKSPDGLWYQVALPAGVQVNTAALTRTTPVSGTAAVTVTVPVSGTDAVSVTETVSTTEAVSAPEVISITSAVSATAAVTPAVASATPAAADAADTAGKAWISADIVTLGGSGSVPVASTDALLQDDLSANWKVDWSCNSDRCQVKDCTADVTAKVNRASSNGLLPVEHNVTWADQCFNTDAWTFNVDQFTGKESSGDAKDNFLYGYWLGAEPGDANGVFPLDDNRGVIVYCSDPQKVEIEEGGGWTTVYEGNTCHDVKTGMLVFMNYSKRWLFTGDYEGKTYDRAYFGDSEKLEQRLVDTTVELDFATKK